MSLRMSALLLAPALWCLVAANTDEAVDCCLETTDRRVSPRVVKSYSIQTPEGGCRIPATVLLTRRNIRLCAPPATGKNWVSKLIKTVEKRGSRKVGRRTSKNRG